MWDPYAKIESMVLPNGLTVYVAEQDKPWVRSGFVIHSGRIHDKEGFEGTAHFVEHMLSRSPRLPKGEEISDKFESVGGDAMLGMTTFQSTSYSFFAPNDNEFLQESFCLFGEMILDTRFDNPLEIELERSVIRNEFHRIFPHPISLAIQAWKNNALYPEGLFKRTVSPIGTVEGIENITKEALEEFHASHYTPPNLSVLVVGGISAREVGEILLMSPLGYKKEGSRSALLDPTTFVTPPLENRKILSTEDHKVLILGGFFEGAAKIPKSVSFATLKVLSSMLDKLLMTEVREKRGWTYSIHTGVADRGSLYELLINCSEFSGSAADEIEDVISETISLTASKPGLFSKTKEAMIAKIRMLDQSGLDFFDKATRSIIDYHRIITLEEERCELEKVTFDDIRQALTYLEPENRWTLILKP